MFFHLFCGLIWIHYQHFKTQEISQYKSRLPASLAVLEDMGPWACSPTKNNGLSWATWMAEFQFQVLTVPTELASFTAWPLLAVDIANPDYCKVPGHEDKPQWTENELSQPSKGSEETMPLSDQTTLLCPHSLHTASTAGFFKYHNSRVKNQY